MENLVEGYLDEWKIPSLKLAQSAKSGHYLTILKTHQHLLPQTGICVQMRDKAKTIAFTTEKLVSLSNRQLQASAEILMISDRSYLPLSLFLQNHLNLTDSIVTV